MEIDNINKYIKFYQRFKTDNEIAEETGLTVREVQKIKNQTNRELWLERTCRSKKRTGRF